MGNGTCPGCHTALVGAETVSVIAPPEDTTTTAGVGEDVRCPKCLMISPAGSLQCECGFDLTKWSDAEVRKTGRFHIRVGVVLVGKFGSVP